MKPDTSPSRTTKPRRWSVLTRVDQLADHVGGIPDERLHAAQSVASEFRFRVPEFYVKNVLNGKSDDPLLDLVLPSAEELEDGEELWDATPSQYQASDSPFWVQKYEFQGLIRVTTFCSGLCRFCYLKKKNAHPRVMREADVHQLFDDLDQRGRHLREVILSGGDPLSAHPAVLALIGERIQRLRKLMGGESPHITVHTREPVWDPLRLMENGDLWPALRQLRAKTFMINVLHPREVTAEFRQVCSRLAVAAGQDHLAALFSQHPLFRGVNDSESILEDLYVKLLSCSPPVIPYYIVHPFYNGTLSRHRLSIETSQEIYRSLLRRPGVLAPRLVVPTPWGKCIVGPNEPLRKTSAGYELVTKDGLTVALA